MVHGIGTYYAVYEKDGLELIISTDKDVIFGKFEESDISGNVNDLYLYRSQYMSEESIAIKDAFDYVDNYRDMIKDFDMIPASPKLRIGEAYESRLFYIEYDEYGDLSMENEGSPYVSFCNILVGDNIDVIPNNMSQFGWRLFYENDDYIEYYMKHNDIMFAVTFYKDNEKIKRWYFTNWPEGEDAMEMWDSW